MQPELKLNEGYQEEEYNGAAAPDRRPCVPVSLLGVSPKWKL